MKQGFSQQQIQGQRQTIKQILSPAQLLTKSLIELPINELEERVKLEIEDNPAIEVNPDSDDNDTLRYDNDNENPQPSTLPSTSSGQANPQPSTDSDYDEDDFEEAERQDVLQDVLMNMGADDELPHYHNDSGMDYQLCDNSSSFIDELNNQIGEHDLTEKQKFIMEYLIGSLDNDGYLRKDLGEISDELEIFQNIHTSRDEIETAVGILHDFDPPGIGAKDLQECLLLQINRRQLEENGELTALMKEVVSDYFKEFTHKHWTKIQKCLKLSDTEAESLFRELTRLNPKPGTSIGEVFGGNSQRIIPDFIVETLDDGSITVSVNNGRVPDLKISESFEEIEQQKETSKQVHEAVVYAREKIKLANTFIGALMQRQHTMLVTMKAIVEKQRKFFKDGDEAAIEPMGLKDIADKTGFSLSTISRVNNNKYVQTRWGIFPMKFFFEDSRFKTAGAEDLSPKLIKQTLKELIDNEDKKAPLSDQFLADVLKKRGFPVARRTVAKYREQMNYPIARLRK